MTRLVGKVISRPLTVVPQEGAQIIWKSIGFERAGNFLGMLVGKLITLYGELCFQTLPELGKGSLTTPLDRNIDNDCRYELYVQYKLCRVPNTIYETTIVPLKYSQWQAAIANGEVDSDKEVEFELTRIYPGGGSGLANSKTVAKIIPAKPIAEDWYSVIDKYCTETPITGSETQLFKWLKSNYNPPTKIKQ